MKRLFATAMMAMMMSIGAQAATVTFNFETAPSGSAASLINNPLVFSESGSEFGVGFTSDLTVATTGLSAGALLLTDSSGIGIFGNSTEINDNEQLLFSSPTATVTIPGSGSAVFSHFSEVTFSEFNAGDSGFLNTFTVNSDGAVDLTTSPYNSPTTIDIEGVSDDLTAPGFQVTQVVAEFIVTPAAAGVAGVPEPSSFAALLLIGGCAATRRRRRS